MLMEGFGTLLWLITLVVLGLAVFAFVDAAIRREDAYRAADKQTKQFWLILLGLAVVVNLVQIPGLGMLLMLVGLIASIVYIVDVRPALKQVAGGGRGGRRGGGSSSDGPYGPFNGR
ncbi:DUF2516 family protein [Streptomyces albiaxialis]|uniref:DUF2516 family protein n=1 Tax=Streptomyces albiaxialis TaxID=329523 RepID=A0ABN2X7E1_9ACTN